MAATFHINVLTDENYSTWKSQMRSVLKASDLWGYVDGSISRPADTDSKLAEWIRMDGKAEAKIYLAVRKSNYTTLDGLSTSKIVWDKLKEMFQIKGPARKASLLKKIALKHLQEEGDLRKHLSEFADAVKELKKIGVVIVDKLLAILLLYSLPDLFMKFGTAMESRDELPTVDVLSTTDRVGARYTL